MSLTFTVRQLKDKQMSNTKVEDFDTTKTIF